MRAIRLSRERMATVRGGSLYAESKTRTGEEKMSIEKNNKPPVTVEMFLQSRDCLYCEYTVLCRYSAFKLILFLIMLVSTKTFVIKLKFIPCYSSYNMTISDLIVPTIHVSDILSAIHTCLF